MVQVCRSNRVRARRGLKRDDMSCTNILRRSDDTSEMRPFSLRKVQDLQAEARLLQCPLASIEDCFCKSEAGKRGGALADSVTHFANFFGRNVFSFFKYLLTDFRFLIFHVTHFECIADEILSAVSFPQSTLTSARPNGIAAPMALPVIIFPSITAGASVTVAPTSSSS